MFPIAAQAYGQITFEVSLRQLKQCPPSFSYAALKLWTHSWETSERYHEASNLGGIFGCVGALDNIQHYVLCRRMNRAIPNATIGHSSFTDLVNEPLLFRRIGIVKPDRNTLADIAIAFHMCHTFKGGHLELIHESRTSCQFGELAQLTKSLAKSSARCFERAL